MNKSKKRAKEEFFDKELEQELLKSVKKIIANKELLSKEIIRLNNLIKHKGIICKIYQDICILGKEQEHCPYCKKKWCDMKNINKTTNKNKNVAVIIPIIFSLLCIIFLIH